MNRAMERAIKELLSPIPVDVASGLTAAKRHCTFDRSASPANRPWRHCAHLTFPEPGGPNLGLFLVVGID